MAVRTGKSVKPYAATKIFLLVNVTPSGDQINGCFSSQQDCVTEANRLGLTNAKSLECVVSSVNFFEKAEGTYAETAAAAQAAEPGVEKKKPRGGNTISNRGKQRAKKTNTSASGGAPNRKVRRASTSANRKKNKT